MSVLDDAFIYRWATIDDIDAAAEAMRQAFDGESEMGIWVRMMMDGSHASASHSSVAVAVVRRTNKIAAVITTCPQIWHYSGIPLKALNITEVGTHPDYQGKGLIGHLMQMIHDTIVNEKYVFSLVWGVPWFYRKFGYYQTLSNKSSVSYARTGIISEWHDEAPYHIRPMRREDVPFGILLHLQESKKSLVSFPYDEAYWNMFVFDYFEQNRDQYRVIEKMEI